MNRFNPSRGQQRPNQGRFNDFVRPGRPGRLPEMGGGRFNDFVRPEFGVPGQLPGYEIPEYEVPEFEVPGQLPVFPGRGGYRDRFSEFREMYPQGSVRNAFSEFRAGGGRLRPPMVRPPVMADEFTWADDLLVGVTESPWSVVGQETIANVDTVTSKDWTVTAVPTDNVYNRAQTIDEIVEQRTVVQRNEPMYAEEHIIGEPILFEYRGQPIPQGTETDVVNPYVGYY